MTASLTNEILTVSNASNGKEFNQFARIEGLGPATRRWLREVFNVHTLEDLAQLSVNRVLANPALSRLEYEGKAICQQKIERWIQQAQEFVAQKTTWQTFATFVVSLQARQVGGQTEQRTTAYFLEADRKKTWSGIECNGVYEMMLDQLKHPFQLEPEVNAPMEPEPRIEPQPRIEFKPVSESELDDENLADENLADEGPAELEPVFVSTTAQSDPALEPESQPEPVADSSVEPISEPLDFEGEIAEPVHATMQLKPDAEVEPAELEAEPEPEAAEPLTIEITQLKIWLPSEPEAPEQTVREPEKPATEEPEVEKAIVVNMPQSSFPGRLQHEKPFTLEVVFQISGTGAVDLTREPLHYQIQCFIQNRETREKMQLESPFPEMLTAGELIYTSRLPETILQQPGAYRFQIVISLDNGHVSPEMFELPFVQVV